MLLKAGPHLLYPISDRRCMDLTTGGMITADGIPRRWKITRYMITTQQLADLLAAEKKKERSHEAQNRNNRV